MKSLVVASDMSLNEASRNEGVTSQSVGLSAALSTDSSPLAATALESVPGCEQMPSSARVSNGTGGVSAQALLDHHSLGVSADVFNSRCKVAEGSAATHDTPVLNTAAPVDSVGFPFALNSHQHQVAPQQLDVSQLDSSQSNKSKQPVLVPQRQQLSKAMMDARMDCSAAAAERERQSAVSETNVQLGGAASSDMGHNHACLSPSDGTRVLQNSDGEAASNNSVESNTLDGQAVGSSASSSSSFSPPVQSVLSEEGELSSQNRRRRLPMKPKDKRVSHLKSRNGKPRNEVGNTDLDFRGDLPLDLNQCYRDIDSDSNFLRKTYYSFVEEHFPAESSTDNDATEVDAGSHIMYLNDESEGDADTLIGFSADVRELLKQRRSVWLVLDSGANQHVFKDVSLLHNKRPTFHKVTGVSGDATHLDCTGDVTLQLRDLHGNSRSLPLRSVFGLNKCPFNLASVNKLIDDKCCLHLDGFSNDYWLRLPHSTMKVPIVRKNGLFMIRTCAAGDSASTSGNIPLKIALSAEVEAGIELSAAPSLTFSGQDYGMTAPLDVWHSRIRHMPFGVMRKIHKHNTSILQSKLKKSQQKQPCLKRKLDSVREQEVVVPTEEEAASTVTAATDANQAADVDDRAVNAGDFMIHGLFLPKDDKKLKKCDCCRQAKARRTPQKKSSPFPESELKQGRVFSCDLKYVPQKSFFGHRYVLCFVEHVEGGVPGITFHYIMKHKSETTQKLQQFFNDCKRFGIKIARIQSDRGTEFFEQEGVGAHFDDRALHSFRELCAKNNIEHTVTPVGDKEKYAERWIKEHFKTVDTYLWNARLSPQFWSYALAYSVFQANRTPSEVNGVWYKAPHHFWTGEVPRWDKWRVFGCDAFSIIPNNKHAKVPGLPTAQRSIFVGFDKDGGALLFDMNKRRHFHASNVYFNESFDNRHNALHYFDQRRALADKEANQPLQVNDFDATSSLQVRNLYSSPIELSQRGSSSSTLVTATTQAAQSTASSQLPRSNVSNGGEVSGHQPSMNNESNTQPASRVGFSNGLQAAAKLADYEAENPLVRPHRVLPVGRVEKYTNHHHLFLQEMENRNCPAVMLQPCPKKKQTPSRKRYIASMNGKTLREIRELGSSTADIVWNFTHGYITFPGHESKQTGHVFSAHVVVDSVDVGDANEASVPTLQPAAAMNQRGSAFNSVLSSVDETSTEELKLLKLVTDRANMLKFAEVYGERLVSLSASVRKPTDGEYIDWHIAAEPTHYNETMQGVCSEHEEWKAAMNEELASMRRFEVFEEIDRSSIPRDRQILGCKWVYKRKRDQHGNIVRYRARVVALGFRQRAYDSFVPEETYSPVVSKDTLRLFLSICAKNNLTIYQADVKAAFLQAPLKEEIYMKAPAGYVNSKGETDVIFKLKRAVYGLKQASSCFWSAVNDHLVRIGFHSLTGDPCLFQKTLSNGKRILVCCYVDDITYAVEEAADGEAFLEEMRQRFFIGKDEGKPIEWLLGMSIKQDVVAGTVHMNMSSMIDKLANLILDDNERRKASSVRTPMLVTPLTKADVRTVPASQFDYLSVVGSLLHIANCVRCDIAFAVSCLARYSMTPGDQHVKAAKRVVQYLYNTRKLGITYFRDNVSSVSGIRIYEDGLHPCDQNKSEGLALKTFGDSDYAMDYTRRSTIGIVVMLNGGPISWTSVLGKTVATSTCEAEVNAAVSAVKDSVHFKLMLQELGMMDESTPIQILEDNSACIAQAEQGIRHVRNAKHYEVKLRFLQQRVLDKEVEFVYCPTDEQLADFFTKPLDEDKFIGFRESMMYFDPSEE